MGRRRWRFRIRRDHARPECADSGGCGHSRSGMASKVKAGGFVSSWAAGDRVDGLFSCPQLCGMNQEALVSAVKSGPRSLRLGQDYDILVVSIDPDDTPAAAAAKRENYLKMMSRPVSQEGFTYLTGTDENIRAAWPMPSALATTAELSGRQISAFDWRCLSARLTPGSPKPITRLDYTPDEAGMPRF